MKLNLDNSFLTEIELFSVANSETNKFSNVVILDAILEAQSRVVNRTKLSALVELINSPKEFRTLNFPGGSPLAFSF